MKSQTTVKDSDLGAILVPTLKAIIKNADQDLQRVPTNLGNGFMLKVKYGENGRPQVVIYSTTDELLNWFTDEPLVR